MKRFLLFFLLLAVLPLASGCKKYSSPNKVSRLIVKDKWKVSYLYINGAEVTGLFSDYRFLFSENGNITVQGEPTISGKWTTNDQSNPTNLEINLTPFLPFNNLNADWSLDICSHKRMEMSVNTSGVRDIMFLTKEEL